MWKVEIEDNEKGFRIFREDCEGQEMATLLEFIPENSDLPKSMSLDFAKKIVKFWNEMEMWNE